MAADDYCTPSNFRRMARGMLLGAILAIAAMCLLVYVAIAAGLVPANADARPPAIERWAARTSLRAVLRREAPPGPNPVALDDANLAAGVKLYAQNCAVCHGAADGRPTSVASGLYQKPPQLARRGVEDDPEGGTYWEITHGIRFTGMPAFVSSLTDEQRWQLTLFLKHMDELPASVRRQWDAVRNP